MFGLGVGDGCPSMSSTPGDFFQQVLHKAIKNTKNRDENEQNQSRYINSNQQTNFVPWKVIFFVGDF